MQEYETTATTSKPLSVSQAMALAKSALESCTVSLVGEVSEVSNKPGYKAVYFTVKDEGASLPAMMWMNRFHAAGVDLRVGMLVQLTGRFTVYAPKGRMNFDVFSLSLAGEGDLRQKVANLAKKLQAEGLMDQSRKRSLPAYPSTIGLVTSPRGAAVHDVLRTLRRRFPGARVALAGVPVEGAGAPAALIEGIRCVSQAGAEVVLLVRGGGSFEDLMPFNDEMLARAIAQCPCPVVTGIGHEPDTSIADMVADLRASTPTATAEAAVPDIFELNAHIASIHAHITNTVLSRIRQYEITLDHIASRPVLNEPIQLYAAPAQALDIIQDKLQRLLATLLTHEKLQQSELSGRLKRAIPANIARDKAQLVQVRTQLNLLGKSLLDTYHALLSQNAARLEDLSPLSVLSRGYTLAKNEAGNLISSIHAVTAGERLALSVQDGTIYTTVENSEASNWEVFTWKDD